LNPHISLTQSRNNKPKKVTLPNGVNTTLYSPGPSTFAKKHKMKRGVLFLGRLTAVKKPELAITSFLRTNPSRDTKMVVMGSGELEDTLKEKYESSQIIFTGAIKNEKQKIDIIRSCQVFILPSVLEGMSLALLEAMACGLACISSDAGNHAEVLGKAGIIVPQKHLSHQIPGILHIIEVPYNTSPLQ
jgi:glycosyltransferase involved in cell wall biosynthesis